MTHVKFVGTLSGLLAAPRTSQGDGDAHKDMALASLGALIAMCLTAFVNSRTKRDFAYEWIESLRVKIPEPLDL
jgi:putative membrane protein